MPMEMSAGHGDVVVRFKKLIVRHELQCRTRLQLVDQLHRSAAVPWRQIEEEVVMMQATLNVLDTTRRALFGASYSAGQAADDAVPDEDLHPPVLPAM
ncbi:hypothetical protein [Caldimonas brevitalea]|uniref:Uncharacterized protein n=1 Tax=Caldimonas brevitalea TaxID=413882 RepID=A0A0G3BWB4_9BURK|nr:hypothetical protein [Caldimonas brevitalea]AKJ30795.1 hypothetical protein AAW51_4104 [Caldimonas brevitalea]